ncbi:MAG: hypothetical protein ABIJ39_08225 [Chloroflexota bacterium]
MKSITHYRQLINEELQSAEDARLAGNEGRARVCARRATGIAIREYFQMEGINLPTRSVITLLEKFSTLPGIEPDLQQAARYLTTRITEDLKLPVTLDLIAEARKLCDQLIPLGVDPPVV